VTPAAPEAERRQLTVMFCDLVGSTALSEKLDPEDLREVIRAYRETCAKVVGRFEGHIAKYIGDGLLVYFGYPQAHEDDAQRAVHAGLGIVEDMQRLNQRVSKEHGVELGVRVGIHTGLVVAGEMGAGEVVEKHAIVGETPNIAARLHELAEPNTVVLSARTQRLVEGLFDCDGLGPQHLKGISEPMPVYQVQGEGVAPSRFEAVAERGLTPLVGREEEIALLLKRWNLAKDGEGQVVLLSGEAGVGKSRILREFRARLVDEPHHRAFYFCSPYHRNTALYPVIGQLERDLHIEKDDGPEQRLDKLESWLGELDLAVDEMMPLLVPLLSPSGVERYPPPSLGPEQLKERTLEALVDVMRARAARQPVLMTVEDAHWVDPSSLEFLSLSIEGLRSARVLLTVSYRPEFEPPWTGRSHLTSLTLNNLGRKESTGLVAAVTGGKALPEEVLGQILAGTDGVPLFVEEMTKTVLESGLLQDVGDHYALSGDSSSLSIPASLQDSLMARLDRLGEEKAVAQLAAMMGRTFSFELLAAVSPLGDEELERALSKLVEAGLIYRHGLPPDVTYEFKHALVRDAAYHSLLKNTRQQYHGQIAQVLEESFVAVETEPEVLAYHFSEAGLPGQAVQYWGKAGERALARYGYEEALGQFERALAGKEGQPLDAETAALLFGLGRAQMSTVEGLQFGEAMANLNRAFNCYAEAGDVARAIAVAEYSPPNHPGLETAMAQVINRALKLVPKDSIEAGRLLSRYGRVLGMHEGDYEGALEAFGRALAIAKREGDAALEMRTLASALYVDFFHRRYKDSVGKGLRAINLAHHADDLQAEVEARYWSCLAWMNTGDLQEAGEHATAVLEPAEKLRHRFWLAGAIFLNENVCRLKGDWRAARDFSDRGLMVSPMAFHLLCTRALLEYETGDFPQGEAHLERLLEVMRLTPPGPTSEHTFTALAIPICSRIVGVDDRFDVAETAAETVFSSRFVPPHHAALTRAGLALMAVQRGDGAAAEEQYAALEFARGTMLVGPGISSDRVLGLLAQTMGRLDEAGAHFEDALTFCGKAGYRPEYAWTCCDYADALLQRNGPGDRAKAMSLLDKGLAISRELGMPPLIERILSRKDNLKA
jgi:class 3 adenylate cyclase/tetratricopeptide (TPR) repeat protein